MKKILTILFVFLFIANTGGLITFYLINCNYHQSKMIEVIRTKENGFETLFLSIIEYNKARIDDKEIYYKGEMYDVKKINFNTETGNVELFVIKDKAEKEIKKKIAFLKNQNNREKESIPVLVKKLLSLHYYVNDIKLLQIINPDNLALFSDKKICYKNPYKHIPSPPPDLA
jgi:hypothetical protein